MARLAFLSLAALSMGTGVLVAAQEQKHITDVSIFTSLAPCAMSALSYVIDYQTSSCGENNDLQSCICTKDNNYAAIGTSLSSSLSWSCTTTATDDFSSASLVYSAYCNPDEVYTFPEPEHTVSRLVTDVPEFFNLAKCAQSALSYAAIYSMTSYCPEDPAHFIPCMCTRNQNSRVVNAIISSSVSYNCENKEDITSAQAFFRSYCNQVNGTTVLPTPTNPPGDMSYYITALGEYSKLVPCAQSAISRVVERQTASLCPEGPQALASCVCIKEGMFSSVSLELTSSVKYSCDSTALEDVTSAVSVLGYYCSAAMNEASPVVTESVEQTYPAAETGTGGNVDSPLPSETGAGGQGGGDGGDDANGDGTRDGSNSDNSDGDGNNNNDSGGGGTNIGPIAGGVAAGAGIVLLGGLIGWLIMRRRKKSAAAAAAAAAASAGGEGAIYHHPGGPGSPPPAVIAGKQELGGGAVTTAPMSPHSPNPSSYKEGTIQTDTVSPVSPYGYPPGYAPPTMASELHGQGGLSVPEMPGTQRPPPAELGGPHQQWAGYPAPGQPMPGQPYGQSLPLPPELQGHQSPPPQGYSPAPPSPHGGQWQYSELGSNNQQGR